MKISKLSHFISLNFSHLGVIGLLFVLNIPNAMPANAPGVLAQQPLQTSATAEPNVMFLIDNSSSMVTNDLPSGDSRWLTLRETMSTLLSDMNGLNVGMATFEDSGSILKPLTLFDKSDPTTHANLVTAYRAALDAEPTGGNGTIPGLVMQNLGRYFANDSSKRCGGGPNLNTELTIHPNSDLIIDGGLQDDVECTTLFGDKTSIKNENEAIVHSCAKSFIIMMTDGETRDDNILLSSHPALAVKDHPFRDYDQDCTATGQIDTGISCDVASDQSPTVTALDTKTSYTYKTNGSDFADDIAQAMFEIDLRPDYSDFRNNVTTYSVGFADAAVNANPLMKHAAEQAGGEYFYASDAASLLSSFQGAIDSIISQTSTSSAVTFNSSTLSSQSAVYQALFNTSSWSGELNSFPLDGISGAIQSDCTQGTDNCWEAAEQLDNQDADDRFILVASDASSKYAVEFTYVDGTNDYTNLNSSSDIPQALVEDLCSVAVGNVSGTSFPCLTSDVATKSANSIYIQDLVAYLRGDNSEEVSKSATRDFRNRISDLGDIVNSSPIFVGTPQQNWPKTGVWPDLDASSVDISYITWKGGSAVTSRPHIVYVASNDGMLHGFRAEAATGSQGENINTSAGEEVFAFIPSDTFSTGNTSGLHFLADSGYTHRFYNDLTPTIADVYMDYRNSSGAPTYTPGGTYSVTTMAKATSTADWRTVLLGSQGGGGKSVYLLDVTDPLEYTTTSKQNAKKLLLWEFSDSDDSSLGYTYSRPIIAMMNNGKFAAIFGNGYNSAGCKAELFVVFLEGGLDGDWTDTGDYYKYDTGTAHGGGAGDCNGLSTPAVVDLNGDGTADRVYAGDLKGNLWVFDLCNSANALTGDACSRLPSTSSGWGIADANPLMNANDGTIGQPITSKPIVSRDPASSGTADLIVVFGTGQYLTDADKSTTGTQRVYGVRDYDALNNSATGGGGAWNLDGNQTSPDKWADTTFAINAGTGARVFASTDTIGSGDYGWRITLPDSGERMVVNPKIRNNILFFNTLIPDSTTCSFGGSGWILSVNLLNGGIPAFPVFDLDGSNTIGDAGDTTTDGIPAGTKLNEIPAESTFLGDNQYTPGSDGTINVRKTYVGDSRDEGRMSWKEIYEAQ